MKSVIKRVAYIESKPRSKDVQDAKSALKNTRYVCGGRVSSFGRSLAVLEELASHKMMLTEINDEVENETLDSNGTSLDKTGEQSDESEDSYDPQSDESEDSDEPIRKKKKIFIIESDESEEESFIELLGNPEQNMITPAEVLEGSFPSLMPRLSEESVMMIFTRLKLFRPEAANLLAHSAASLRLVTIASFVIFLAAISATPCKLMKLQILCVPIVLRVKLLLRKLMKLLPRRREVGQRREL